MTSPSDALSGSSPSRRPPPPAIASPYSPMHHTATWLSAGCARSSASARYMARAVKPCSSGALATSTTSARMCSSRTYAPALRMTSIIVDTCQRLSGAWRCTSAQILLVRSALNSVSATSRYCSSSDASVVMLLSLTRPYTSSSARRRMLMSLSLTHSTMVLRCRCTAAVSTATTVDSVLSAT